MGGGQEKNCILGELKPLTYMSVICYYIGYYRFHVLCWSWFIYDRTHNPFALRTITGKGTYIILYVDTCNQQILL